MSKLAFPIPSLEPGQRRYFTVQQKRTLLDEATKLGQTVSSVARRYGVAPSLLFYWKRVMDDATKKSLRGNEQVVPLSEVKKLKARIRALERALGRKSMDVVG